MVRPQLAASFLSEAAFQQLLRQVEDALLAYYGLEVGATAADFLIQEQELAGQLEAGSLPVRAAVCVQQQQEAEEELFMSLFFTEELKQSLLAGRPLEGLNQRNLDAYCVLVEELSHFHLIYQRAQQKRQVSQLELEWQGEVDKFLLAAMLLDQQTGNPHVQALSQLLFDQAILYVGQTHYREANKHAAQFWLQAIAQGIGQKFPLTHAAFRAFMQANYHRPLQEKVPFTPIKLHFA